MTQFEVGDKVKLEGTVTRVHAYGIDVDGLNRNAARFELVERPRPALKVGDSVTDYHEVPPGVVLALDESPSHPLLSRGNGEFSSRADGVVYASELSSPRQVVYIPGA